MIEDSDEEYATPLDYGEAARDSPPLDTASVQLTIYFHFDSFLLSRISVQYTSIVLADRLTINAIDIVFGGHD